MKRRIEQCDLTCKGGPSYTCANQCSKHETPRYGLCWRKSSRRLAGAGSVGTAGQLLRASCSPTWVPTWCWSSPRQASGLRVEPPFLDDRPGIERSLRSRTTTRASAASRSTWTRPKARRCFASSSTSADLVIETERPASMSARARLRSARRVQPALVVSSITPFGQTGPYAQYAGEDLVGLALGGLLYLGGYPDAAPTRVLRQPGLSCARACTARSAAMHRGAGGRDDRRRASTSTSRCRNAWRMALENAVQFYDLEGTVRKRRRRAALCRHRRLRVQGRLHLPDGGRHRRQQVLGAHACSG